MRFSYLWIQKVFVSLDPKGFRKYLWIQKGFRKYLWIQKVFVFVSLDGFGFSLQTTAAGGAVSIEFSLTHLRIGINKNDGRYGYYEQLLHRS